MRKECKNRAWLALWSPPGSFVHLSVSQYVTDADSTSRLKSVTQEGDLDEFLNTAQLAGTDFTAGVYAASST
jgi:hypothetical protein